MTCRVCRCWRLFQYKINFRNRTSYKFVQFTFQIGLHKDEREVLNYIQKNLRCGKISVSGDRLNFFVNDQACLLYVILPIFNTINLNSSKYYHFNLFNKAVLLLHNKQHLTAEGKLLIFNIKKTMQTMKDNWIPSNEIRKITITKYWLAGFIDGKGSFSTNTPV